MRTKARNPFTTVRSEGALLPPELLQRIAEGGKDLGGLRPTDYHLGEHERLTEAISRSWNRLIGLWASFGPSVEDFDEKDPGTTPTREKWLLPLFDELGFGRLQTAKAQEIEGKSYPVSHAWQDVPIHLVGAGLDLDRRAPGVAGAARTSPHSLLQELLNRTPSLWGVVSNGKELRLLRDNVSLTRQAFVSFDLHALMEGELYSDFALLWLLCHQSRFEGERPEESWLERWRAEAAQQGTRALDTLRRGVEQAIDAVGAGFLAHPTNGPLREALRQGALGTQDYYRELLRLVYRLIFLFVAEDRLLLHPPETTEGTKRLYHDYYSTARLRSLAERRRGTKHADLYRALVLVMDKLGRDEGCPELGLPFMGGFLFSDSACPDLENAEISNRDLLAAVRALAFTEEGRTLRPVDYRNIGSEELGSIYESLLELHPELHLESASFTLTTAAGSERKTTGSYYTPSSLVAALLDSALDPVLEEAARSSDAESAILELKVCDPATGSGHFLVAAAHRIAKRLASVRTGDEEPAPDAYRAALRDVIARCLYGVDVNPMAVELCKVSLWMEAMDPGKPLSFLDHHIVGGNSLLGATPRLLTEGIPDEAFKPLEGDDKKVVSELKRRNSQERKGQQVLALGPSVADLARPIAEVVAAIDAAPGESAGELHRKERAWEKLQHSKEAAHAKLVADAWCAAFVIPKEKGAPVLTEGVYRLLASNPQGGDSRLHAEIERLAEDYRFLHPHLAFPRVFRLPSDGEEPENPETGWSGGFDVVLGNPPWLSYSGRQRVATRPGELSLLNFLYPETSAWPSSHSAFILRSLSLLSDNAACGLVAPLQVLHLERYGHLREHVKRRWRTEVKDAGEEAFEGVSQRVGLYTFARSGSVTTPEQWHLQASFRTDIDFRAAGTEEARDEIHDGLSAELFTFLQGFSKFPSAAFADPGVHTGNVSKVIVSEAFPHDDPSYAPVREGRDITAYYCGPPRKRLWVRPSLEHGQYCTIRPIDVYVQTPILLRQTADRPIACRHVDRTFFRNSLLACRGVTGVPDEVIVAVLNSELVRRWYQNAVQESGQRAFPQVKVKNLRNLPLFPLERLTEERNGSSLGLAIIDRTQQAEGQRRASGIDSTVLLEIESLVCRLYGLPEALTEQLIQSARSRAKEVVPV